MTQIKRTTKRAGRLSSILCGFLFSLFFLVSGVSGLSGTQKSDADKGADEQGGVVTERPVDKEQELVTDTSAHTGESRGKIEAIDANDILSEVAWGDEKRSNTQESLTHYYRALTYLIRCSDYQVDYLLRPALYERYGIDSDARIHPFRVILNQIKELNHQVGFLGALLYFAGIDQRSPDYLQEKTELFGSELSGRNARVGLYIFYEMINDSDITQISWEHYVRRVSELKLENDSVSLFISALMRGYCAGDEPDWSDKKKLRFLKKFSGKVDQRRKEKLYDRREHEKLSDDEEKKEKKKTTYHQTHGAYFTLSRMLHFISDKMDLESQEGALSLSLASTGSSGGSMFPPLAPQSPTSETSDSGSVCSDSSCPLPKLRPGLDKLQDLSSTWGSFSSMSSSTSSIASGGSEVFSFPALHQPHLHKLGERGLWNNFIEGCTGRKQKTLSSEWKRVLYYARETAETTSSLEQAYTSSYFSDACVSARSCARALIVLSEKGERSAQRAVSWLVSYCSSELSNGKELHQEDTLDGYESDASSVSYGSVEHDNWSECWSESSDASDKIQEREDAIVRVLRAEILRELERSAFLPHSRKAPLAQGILGLFLISCAEEKRDPVERSLYSPDQDWYALVGAQFVCNASEAGAELVASCIHPAVEREYERRTKERGEWEKKLEEKLAALDKEPDQTGSVAIAKSKKNKSEQPGDLNMDLLRERFKQLCES